MSHLFNKINSRQCSSGKQTYPVANPLNFLSTPKSEEVGKVNEFYDHVEAHLNGVVKVLKPMLEINNIINKCVSKSDDHQKRENSRCCANTKISYYTPQKGKCSNSTSGDRRQCCNCKGKSSGKKVTEDISKNCPPSTSTKPTFNLPPVSCSTKVSQSKKENTQYKISSSSSQPESSQRHQEKKINTHEEFDSKNCSACGIHINKAKILAVMECKHVFCYPCMSEAALNTCPNCSRPIKRETIRNITSKTLA